MSWNTLGAQIFSLVDDNKTALGIQEVYSYPRLKFDGFPACSIFPSSTESDYETTTENRRVYAWRVNIFEEVKDQGMEQALSTLYPVIDATMDKFDEENELDSGQTIGQSMPANYTFINIFSTPGTWVSIDDENLIYNQFTIRIMISFDAS